MSSIRKKKRNSIKYLSKDFIRSYGYRYRSVFTNKKRKQIELLSWLKEFRVLKLVDKSFKPDLKNKIFEYRRFLLPAMPNFYIYTGDGHRLICSEDDYEFN